MLLDLSRLRGGTERFDRRLEPAAFAAAAEDFRVLTPVALIGEVEKDGDKVRLRGRLETRLETTCSRCLEVFEVPMAMPLDLLFLPASIAIGGEIGKAASDEDDGEAVADDDLGVSFYRDDVLDLVEIVQEQFYLALPMKPLCTPDCRGLCPVCGINRNRETCTCKTEWVDPRLEGLRRLRPDS
jgi:uncharacterized protein